MEYFEHNVNKTIENIGAFLRAKNTLDQIILNCQNLITFLDKLENAIVFSKLNVLHASVISASELEQMISYLTKVYDQENIIQFKDLISLLIPNRMYASHTHRNKILFAIHLPIFLKQKFEIYRLFPIRLNNTAIIPSHPYLVLGTDQLQYEDEKCPSIENVCICQNQLENKEGSCEAAFIQNAESKNCHLTPTRIMTSIMEVINSQHILSILAVKPLKLRKAYNDSGLFG